jgi:hypothetical protein
VGKSNEGPLHDSKDPLYSFGEWVEGQPKNKELLAGDSLRWLTLSI